MPDFRPGDTLRVAVKVVEGERTRTQAFEGVCIARSNKGLQSATSPCARSATARAWSACLRCIRRRSPRSQVVRRGDVRRAKLYYLRGRSGKSARIAERARDVPWRRRGAAPWRSRRRPNSGGCAGGGERPWPEQAPHPVRQGMGQPRRRASAGRHLRALHRPAPRARGDQPAGLRGAAAGRAQGAPAGCDARGGGPQHPDLRPPRRASRRRKAASRWKRWSSNVAEFGVPYIPVLDARQGIVHIIGPEQGTQPARHDHRLRRLAIPPRMARWARWRSASAPPRSSTCWRRRRCCRSRRRTCWSGSTARCRRAARRRTSCWRSSAGSAPPAAPAT